MASAVSVQAQEHQRRRFWPSREASDATCETRLDPLACAGLSSFALWPPHSCCLGSRCGRPRRRARRRLKPDRASLRALAVCTLREWATSCGTERGCLCDRPRRARRPLRSWPCPTSTRPFVCPVVCVAEAVLRSSAPSLGSRGCRRRSASRSSMAGYAPTTLSASSELRTSVRPIATRSRSSRAFGQATWSARPWCVRRPVGSC